MIACPHCHEPCISGRKKLHMAMTFRPGTCPSCMKKIGVDGKRFAGLVLLIVFTLLAFAGEYPFMVIASAPIWYFLFMKWIPLRAIDD